MSNRSAHGRHAGHHDNHRTSGLEEGREAVTRHRSRSPRRSDEHHSGPRTRRPSPRAPVRLPFGARPLHKRDLAAYRGLLRQYLDLQKRLTMADLSEDEVKGRWKSFLGKWNRGELVEGWYEPATKQRADEEFIRLFQESAVIPRMEAGGITVQKHTDDQEDDEDEDEFGPEPPPPSSSRQNAGPNVPTLQDLELREELVKEDRSERIDDLRYDRKVNRKVQKERLEDLVPRTDPGSRERQLEKKREKTDAVRSFRDEKEAGDVEVGEGDLMGEDGIDSYKTKKKVAERQKNEREIRKEEVLRAREAEREERLAEHRAKEDKTMEMLRTLARQNFGGGGS